MVLGLEDDYMIWLRRKGLMPPPENVGDMQACILTSFRPLYSPLGINELERQLYRDFAI
jgi:hypothetical protein